MVTSDSSCTRLTDAQNNQEKLWSAAELTE
jgi:hypothetical protein